MVCSVPLPLLLTGLGIVSLSQAIPDTGNVVIQGTRKPGDELLFEYRLSRRAKPLQVLTETVVYPMTLGQKSGPITLLETHSPKSHHDDVTVKGGGVGHSFVKLRFRSARSRGLDYVIKVYGFPSTGDGVGPLPDGLAEPPEHVEPSATSGSEPSLLATAAAAGAGARLSDSAGSTSTTLWGSPTDGDSSYWQTTD